METDVLITGGGPAGLAAAFEAGSRGCSVTIVDSAWCLGGQMHHQTQVIDSMPSPYTGMRGFEIAEEMEERLRSFSVDYFLKHEVAGLFADGTIGISDGNVIKKIKAKSIIAATGAAEMALPFPGWTLPGVITAGAAQQLINRERVCPGRKCIIVGTFDIGLDVAIQLKAIGVEVLCVVEAGETIAADEKKHLAFRENGISVLFNTEVAEASGRGKVQEVLLRSGKTTTKHEVDFICTAGGFQPVIDIFSAFRCGISYRRELGGRLPQYDRIFQTSMEGLFAAGQAAGITCHGGIYLTGALAGISAAARSKGASPDSEDSAQKYWRELEQIEASLMPAVWSCRQEHINAGITAVADKC